MKLWCHSGLSQNNFFMLCGSIFIEKILICGRYKRNPRKLGKKWWKISWFYSTFLWIVQEDKKYYVMVIKLYTDPDDLLFLLLAFWMIRASALQFARSLVKSTDGWKNKLACSNFHLERNVLFSYIYYTEINVWAD